MSKVRQWVDARSRAFRTFLQGLVAAVLVGVWPVISALLAKTSIDWSIAVASIEHAALTAGVTFVWRAYLDPSRIPSALPPGEKSR